MVHTYTAIEHKKYTVVRVRYSNIHIGLEPVLVVCQWVEKLSANVVTVCVWILRQISLVSLYGFIALNASFHNIPYHIDPPVSITYLYFVANFLGKIINRKIEKEENPKWTKLVNAFNFYHSKLGNICYVRVWRDELDDISYSLTSLFEVV